MSAIIRIIPFIALLASQFVLVSPFPARAELDLDTSASLFGQRPAVWGMRLSPDGQKVSFLKVHPEGFPIAMVIDLQTGKGNLVLASDAKKGVDLTKCDWANSTRLLCIYFGTWHFKGSVMPATRLVAVDIDGKNIDVLVQREQQRNNEFALNQSDIVDLLPDDPDNIWLHLRKDNGFGVSRVDINENRTKTVERALDGVWDHYTDGKGEIRIRNKSNRTSWDFQYRLAGENQWKKLHRYRADDRDDPYWPAAIEPGSNELLVWDTHEGRRALFKEWLVEDSTAPRKRELVNMNAEVDLSGIMTIGKYGRAVGVAYRTDKPQVDYFDDKIKAVHDKISGELEGQIIRLIDESWDGQFYLVHASSDIAPGAYYRYDTQTDVLSLITKTYPWLEDVDLAKMVPIRYSAKDGASVPGYLTQPPNTKGPLPLIVLPHGGPSSRDEWGYDHLPQFFVSRGYAVLQANYRGSEGYGEKWLGDGGFKGWRTVTSDIDAGLAHLIEKGIADPERICIAGWSFGGYAALIAALEMPARYRCVVSIAGVTHPRQLIDDVWQGNSLERNFTREFIPSEPKEIVQGSPLKRASEMSVPVLLMHGNMDLHVNVDHSRDLEKALDRAKKSVEYVEYKGADHFIGRQRDRIDLFQQLGDFLDKHLTAKPHSAHTMVSAGSVSETLRSPHTVRLALRR